MARKFVVALALGTATAFGAPAWAHSHASTKESDYTEAEVRKVDHEAGKVTLRHGAIGNLEMPPMTMVFRVKDAAMIKELKEGDKVQFRAEKVQGAYTVTELKPAVSK